MKADTVTPEIFHIAWFEIGNSKRKRVIIFQPSVVISGDFAVSFREGNDLPLGCAFSSR